MWRRGVCPLHATEARPEQQSHVSSEPWWRGLQNRTCFVFASEETLWEGYCFWRQEMPGEAAHSHLVCFFELFWAYDVTCKHEGGPHDAPNVPACWCHPDFNMLNTPFGNSRVEVFLSYWALGSIASAAGMLKKGIALAYSAKNCSFTHPDVSRSTGYELQSGWLFQTTLHIQHQSRKSCVCQWKTMSWDLARPTSCSNWKQGQHGGLEPAKLTWPKSNELCSEIITYCFQNTHQDDQNCIFFGCSTSSMLFCVFFTSTVTKLTSSLPWSFFSPSDRMGSALMRGHV